MQTIKKLPTDIIVKFDKNENIKKLHSPYDNDIVINSPLVYVAQHNNDILKNLFKSFGDAIR